MKANDINEVIKLLDDIILWAKENKSRLGYFPALYRKVTIKVRDGTKNGEFEDGPRMELLDVNFANRYFVAYDKYRNGEKATKVWMVALNASRDWWPIVLQHLLLGMNAHINLDLGIAAAQTVKKGEIKSLHNDFNKINDILFSLVNEVEDELAKVWPALGLLDKIAGRTDEAIVEFSMGKARDSAWDFALKLDATENAAEFDTLVNKRDKASAKLGDKVLHPGFIVGSVLRFIKLRERGTIPEIIDILS